MKFIVKFYPSKTSFNGILLSYLNQFKTTTFAKKEKILKAISAYWLPFACQWAGYEEGQVRQLALSSINQLQWHIQYLREAFNLPEPVRGTYDPTPARDYPMPTQSRTGTLVEPRSPSSSDFERRTDFSDEEESFLSSL